MHTLLRPSELKQWGLSSNAFEWMDLLQEVEANEEKGRFICAPHIESGIGTPHACHVSAILHAYKLFTNDEHAVAEMAIEWQ